MKAPLRLLWLVAFPAEAGAGWLLFGNDPVGIAAGFVLHVAASAIFGLSLFGREGGGRAWPLLGWALSLVAFPLLGMLVTAMAFALRAVFGGPGTARVEEPGGPARPAAEVISRAREVEVSLLEEREIEPVVDVLREDDPAAKRAAIEALTKQRGEGTVRLLVGLLHDPSPEARLFASLSLSKLEDGIARSILEAQRALEEDPGSPEKRENLADLYLDYVLSGFLEGAARDYYLDLAREAFEAALEVGKDPDRLALRLARVHLMLGDIAVAAALLDDLARRRPDDAEVHLSRMEVIYHFGDLRELSVYARRALERVPEDAEGRELFEWWAGPRAEVAAGAV